MTPGLNSAFTDFPIDLPVASNMEHSYRKYDIFGKLPLEISQQIAAHFELYQVFQARRVCHRWRDILFSHIAESTLYSWCTGTEIPLQVPGDLPPAGITALQAEHVDAFCNGTAFSMALGLYDSDPYPADPRELTELTDYAAGMVAWANRKDSTVRVRCLSTGSTKALFVPPTEEIVYVAVSAAVLAVTTYQDICYVFPVRDGISSILRRPSQSFAISVLPVMNIVFSGNIIAILHGATQRNHATVDTWNIETLEAQQLSFKLHDSWVSDVHSFDIIIAKGGMSIIFFERVLEHRSFVYYTRTALGGETEIQGSIEHPNVQGYTQHYEHTVPSSRSSTRHGDVTLWTYVRCEPLHPHRWEVLRFCYNMRTDQLGLKKQSVDGPGNYLLEDIDFFWWKDIAYVGSDNNTPAELTVIDLNQSVRKKAAMSASEVVRKELMLEDLDRERADMSSTFMGDETFLLEFRHCYYIVWCFDKNINMADEIKEYREWMQEQRRCRAV